MKQLTFTKSHFDLFVFPQVGTAQAKSDSEFEAALRLLRKLKDPALTVEKPLTQAEEEAEKNGDRVFRFYRLLEDQATFLLQDDEFRLLKDRITGHKTTVSLVAVEEFNELLQVLKDPPEVEVEPVKEATESPG